MKRIVIVLVLSLILVTLIAALGCGGEKGSTTPTPTPTYIPLRLRRDVVEESRIFLVDSELRYGVYDRDIHFALGKRVFAGDDAVIISGTIRNDYEEDYYFVAISATLYNSEGDEVGAVFSPSSPLAGMAVARVPRGSVSPFEIWVKYDRQDVTDYELFLPYPPSPLSRPFP